MKRSLTILPIMAFSLIPLAFAPTANAVPASADIVTACSSSTNEPLPSEYSVRYSNTKTVEGMDYISVTEQVLDFNGRYCAVVFVEGLSQLPDGTALDKISGTYERSAELQVEGYDPVKVVPVEKRAMDVRMLNADEAIVSTDVFSYLDFIVVPESPVYPQELWGQEGVLYAPEPLWTVTFEGKVVTGTTGEPTEEQVEAAQARYQAKVVQAHKEAAAAKNAANRAGLKGEAKKAEFERIRAEEDAKIAQAYREYEDELASGGSSTNVPFTKSVAGSFA